MNISTATFESPLPVSADRAWAWHTRTGAIDRMLPPWQPIRLLDRGEGLAEGSTVSFRLGRPPLSLDWLARHEQIRPGHGFCDRQTRGPFRSWLHRRELLPESEEVCRLRETIEYELPLSTLSQPLLGNLVRRQLQRTFAYRHRVLAGDLAVQKRYGSSPRMRVAVSGASGLVGSALVALLTTAGHEVVRLVRSPEASADAALWDPRRGLLEPEKLDGVDAVVHLAGENIAGGRWTERRKEEIRRSRRDGTASLVASLAALPSPPRHFLSASAVGFYGDTGTDTVDETHAGGSGFLAEVCREWEQAAARARSFARVATLRFGVILTPAGGALAKMLPPFRLGAGGVVGSGRQMMSWISLDDAVDAVLHCLASPSLSGPINVTAPSACTNRELTRALGRILRRPTIAPLPAPVVRLLFGEMGEAMLLASTDVAPRRLVASGFEYRHPKLDGALSHLLGRDAGMPSAAAASRPDDLAA